MNSINNTNPDRYVVIGNPITHSLSPQIHTHFAKQTQQQLIYNRLCVEPEFFFSTLDKLFEKNLKGANITAPFKSMAFEYVTQDYCSKAAKLAKAVNTLYINPHDNRIWGDNTDGTGLLRHLKYLEEKHALWNISRKKLLILGTGGAVRGILPALLSEKPESITLYNRTRAKSSLMSREFQALGNVLPLVSPLTSYDIILNAIPSTEIRQSEVWSWLPETLSKNTCIYDLSYSQQKNQDTPFIKKIKSDNRKIHITDGLGMLIEQAAESFFIWRGVRPDTHFVF